MALVNDFHLGQAKLIPNQAIVAGELSSWTIIYTVGKYGLDNGGQVKVAWRWVSDWGIPQFTKPEREGFTSVVTNGEAKIRPSWHDRGYIRPKSMCMLLEIYDGSLAPGETITVVLGDTSQGSPGIRAQTYIESEFELFIVVDPTNSTNPRPINDRLVVPVIAAETESLDCIISSQSSVNELYSIRLVANLLE
jgi:hypothetical protein